MPRYLTDLGPIENLWQILLQMPHLKDVRVKFLPTIWVKNSKKLIIFKNFPLVNFKITK